MADVVKFYPQDAAKEPDNVIEQAMGQYKSVLIIGWDNDDKFDARATLDLKDGGDVLWLMEIFKFKMLNGDFMGDDE